MPSTSVASPSTASMQERETDEENPAVNQSMVNSVRKVFSEIQKSASTHRRNILLLVDLHRKDFDSFFHAFIECLNHVLLVYKREPAVERIVTFISLACRIPVSEQTGGLGDSFAVKLIRYLLEFSCAKEKAVRFRVTQIVGNLVNGLQSDEAVDVELWDDLETRLLDRAHDKLPTIRAGAATALERLHDPDAPLESSPVLATYLRMMGADQNKEVRKAAIRAVPICRPSIEAIIARCNDVAEDVQVCAFQQISERVPFAALTIKQRADVLKLGLRSRSGKVRKACEAILTGPWLEANNEDVPSLVKELDPEEQESVVADALRYYYRSNPVVYNSKLGISQDAHSSLMPAIDLEELSIPAILTLEKAIMLRVRCQVSAEKRDGSLDELIPDTLSFCELFETHGMAYMNLCENRDAQDLDPESEEAVSMDEGILRQDFIMHQLLGISRVLGLEHDQVGRRRLTVLLTNLVTFSGTEPDTVHITLDVLHSASTSESEFSQLATSTVSEIQDPLSGQGDESENISEEDMSAQLENLAEEYESYRREKQQCIENNDIETLDEIVEAMKVVEAKVSKLEKLSGPTPITSLEPWRALRCLQVIGALLRFSRKTSLPTGATGFFENFILPTIQSKSSLIRKEAVKCLGLYCSKDLSSAQELMTIFKAFVEEVGEREEIRVVALQAIFDIVLMLGMDAETGKTPGQLAAEDGDDNDEDTSHLNEEELRTHKQKLLTDFLLSTLDDESQVIRCTTAEGLAKLLFVGRLYDPRVLQCMIALYFHPKSAGDQRLRQCLSVFFPSFIKTNQRNRDTIELIALPMIRAMLSPTATTDLQAVDFGQVLSFFIFLLSASSVGNQDGDLSTMHGDFAIGLLLEVAALHTSPHIRVVSKCLNFIEVHLLSDESIKSLIVLVDEIVRAGVKDKVAVKQLEKWKTQLIESVEDPDVSMDEDQVAELVAAVERRAIEITQQTAAQHKGSSSRRSTRGMRQAASGKANKKQQREDSATEEELSSDEEQSDSSSDGGSTCDEDGGGSTCDEDEANSTNTKGDTSEEDESDSDAETPSKVAQVKTSKIVSTTTNENSRMGEIDALLDSSSDEE